jgi:hypothetical protein
MSIAAMTQLISVSTLLDGHLRLGQRCMTSPSGFTISVSQSGQCVGILNGFVPFWCGRTGPTTCGITSPARWTMTTSPSRMSFRLMSSSLCRVAFVTVTPPTSTGSSCAHGLRFPVRPTRTWIFSSFVWVVSGAHLKARAQRGRPWSAPRRACWSSESTLITMPSIS